MRTSSRITLTSIVIGIVAFLFTPMAPLGSLVWSMPAGGPDPSGIQIALFMFYTAIVCGALGFGISYWIFGISWTKRLFPRMTALAHVALGYVPASFWLHDNLHMINGENINGLIAIEYLFHVPMILVGVSLIAATILAVRADGPGYTATA